MKCLGKWFDGSLKDAASVKNMVVQVKDLMDKVDRSGLPGKFKTWCYQYGVLPRILWPLMIYEVPVSTVEDIERKISGYIRRWLGVPSSLSRANLYIYQRK